MFLRRYKKMATRACARASLQDSLFTEVLLCGSCLMIIPVAP